MASAPGPLQVDALEQQQWVIAQLPNGNGRNPYWSFARKSSAAEIAITLGRFPHPGFAFCSPADTLVNTKKNDQQSKL